MGSKEFIDETDVFQIPDVGSTKQVVVRPSYVDSLKQCQFYYGLLCDDLAHDRLHNDGDFVLGLRYRSTLKKVVCLVKWSGTVLEYEFCQVEGREGISLDNFHFKATVLEVVNFHTSTKTPISSLGVLLSKEIKKQDQLLNMDNITLGKVLGGGVFGKVYQGELTLNGKVVSVAVKIPRAGNEKALKKATEEANVQKEYIHQNVVRLYGTVLKEDQFSIILEYLESGSMDVYLQNNETTQEQRLAFCFDVALGLEYLHNNECLHGDMAARNCLVDKKHNCAKIGDFGLAVKGISYKVPKTRPTPIRWMAPETLMDYSYERATDIWSLGVVFWEIYTKCESQPYGKKGLMQVQLELWANPKFHCDISEDTPQKLKDVLLASWNHEPKKRPVVAKIVEDLLEFNWKSR
ncbi:unnamed protein product [Bursaphelenchus okinawaensis]|uniref:Protein kinase domain-containing protein n=1 Tax=Bursaphelenchus okinawaensis TaxID=465554 RepID=A0A811K9X1_9BILA|nr:unnamed protein product [Bursaphelenchus okinawaensis]CAG9096538.1 unnamed protein product [Bursaphelenchus okinawaensis]